MSITTRFTEPCSPKLDSIDESRGQYDVIAVLLGYFDENPYEKAVFLQSYIAESPYEMAVLQSCIAEIP